MLKKPKDSRIHRLVTYEDGLLWFHKKAGAIVYIGVTHEAIEEIGRAESVVLPQEGDDFSKDEIACEIKGAEGTVDVVLPASGLVKKANSNVEKDIHVLNDDPIDEGWLFKIEIQDSSDLEEFY